MEAYGVVGTPEAAFESKFNLIHSLRASACSSDTAAAIPANDTSHQLRVLKHKNRRESMIQ